MGIKLPKLKIGRFLRKTIAPLIPGGAQAAEGLNTAIKSVKGQKPQGFSQTVNAATAAVQQINEAEQRKALIQTAFVVGGIILLVFLVRRR